MVDTILNLDSASELRVARRDFFFSLLLIHAETRYFHRHESHELREAIALVAKVEDARQIRLAYWDAIDGSVEIHDKYLIRDRGRKLKAHIWMGTDTACRMWSTGGLGHGSSSYQLFATPLDKDICTMCVSRHLEAGAGQTL